MRRTASSELRWRDLTGSREASTPWPGPTDRSRPRHTSVGATRDTGHTSHRYQILMNRCDSNSITSRSLSQSAVS